jgi:hypothetical protein
MKGVTTRNSGSYQPRLASAVHSCCIVQPESARMRKSSNNLLKLKVAIRRSFKRFVLVYWIWTRSAPRFWPLSLLSDSQLVVFDIEVQRSIPPSHLFLTNTRCAFSSNPPLSQPVHSGGALCVRISFVRHGLPSDSMVQLRFAHVNHSEAASSRTPWNPVLFDFPVRHCQLSSSLGFRKPVAPIVSPRYPKRWPAAPQWSWRPAIYFRAWPSWPKRSISNNNWPYGRMTHRQFKISPRPVAVLRPRVSNTDGVNTVRERSRQCPVWISQGSRSSTL